MFRLLSGMRLESYQPRIYLIAETDKMSPQKVEQFEKNYNHKYEVQPVFIIKAGIEDAVYNACDHKD